MSFLKWFSDTFISATQPSAPQDQQPINPASGLPIVGSVDTAGNIYGTVSHDYAPSPSPAAHDWHSSSPTYPDPSSSSSSSWTPSQDFSRAPTSSSGDW